MIAVVREGKLLTMEGDHDHIVNRGSLCLKGIPASGAKTSPTSNHSKRRDRHSRQLRVARKFSSRDIGLERGSAYCPENRSSERTAADC